MKKLVILVVLTLPACENPRLNIGASVSPQGVTVTPWVSGRVGGVGVAVGP